MNSMSIINVLNLTSYRFLKILFVHLECNVYARVKFPRLFRYETISLQDQFWFDPLIFSLAILFRFTYSRFFELQFSFIVDSFRYNIPMKRSTDVKHSRSQIQSLRFIWSRGRRNVGLWWQQLRDVRGTVITVLFCVCL